MMKHWRNLFDESIISIESYRADVETLMELFEELRPGEEELESSAFNCTKYEDLLRSFRNVGGPLQARSVIEIIGIFLTHERIAPNPSLDHTQIAWDRTSYNILHEKNDEDFFFFFMERFDEFSAADGKRRYDCHGKIVNTNKRRSQ